MATSHTCFLLLFLRLFTKIGFRVIIPSTFSYMVLGSNDVLINEGKLRNVYESEARILISQLIFFM